MDFADFWQSEDNDGKQKAEAATTQPPRTKLNLIVR
jgi:hypothetical protein